MTERNTGLRFAICMASGFLVGSALVAVNATADTVYSPAGVCNWRSGVDFAVTDSGSIENMETSGAEHRFSCDLSTPGDTTSQTNDDVFVLYRDNNNGPAMDHAIYCNVVTCAIGDTSCYQEQTRFGCSTLGGCTSAPLSWTGGGSLLFTDINRPSLYKTSLWCAVPARSGTPSIVQSFWFVD